MPDLVGCCQCGRQEGDLWFSPTAGTLFCAAHSGQTDLSQAVAVSGGVLAALRHILYGDFERCFAFSLPAADTADLATLMERFLLAQLQRSFKTLDFYHSLRS